MTGREVGHKSNNAFSSALAKPCPFHFDVTSPRVRTIRARVFACPPHVEKLRAFSLCKLHRAPYRKGRERPKRNGERRHGGVSRYHERVENGENRLTALLYEPRGASCVVHVKKALTLLLLLLLPGASIASSFLRIFIFSTRSFLAYIIM